MNTFLPYPSFRASAKVLDNKRLGKQRMEVWQIYLALTKKDYGWKNHPAVKMWKGFERALVDYGQSICIEWQSRGFKDQMLNRFVKAERKLSLRNDFLLPSWLGCPGFHGSHRSNLLRKNPIYYGNFGWKESIDLPYIWPIGKERV